MKIALKLIKKISLLSMTTLPLFTFAEINCPTQVDLSCVKQANKPVCTITSFMKNQWSLSVPSILQTGQYVVNYSMSFYGMIRGINKDAGYCMYAVDGVPAFIGLYNAQYVKTGDNWQKSSFGYVCQNAQKCLFKEII